jgi:hypothetical protein
VGGSGHCVGTALGFREVSRRRCHALVSASRYDLEQRGTMLVAISGANQIVKCGLLTAGMQRISDVVRVTVLKMRELWGVVGR